MSNSSLVNYTKLSPNHSSRNGHKISKITIHHMAGNASVETCGNIFASSNRQASANYGVDSNGRVGLYVDEAYRSWASSNRANDEVAVTIEVANDEYGGNWHVSDTALQKTIELCVDICKRNGIKQLNFTGDKNGNLTMHKYFIATACPGPYLASKFPYIAAEVNKRLGASSGNTSNGNVSTSFKVGDIVKITGSTYYSGESIPSWVRAKNWIVYQVSGDRVIINKSEDGANAIMSVVRVSDIVLAYSKPAEPVKPTEPIKPAEPEKTEKPIEEDEDMIRYKTIEEMPSYYRAEAQELVDLGFNGKGGTEGLDVSEDMLRSMIVCLRMCKAMIAALPEQTIDKAALFEEFKKNLKLTVEVQ